MFFLKKKRELERERSVGFYGRGEKEEEGAVVEAGWVACVGSGVSALGRREGEEVGCGFVLPAKEERRKEEKGLMVFAVVKGMGVGLAFATGHGGMVVEWRG